MTDWKRSILIWRELKFGYILSIGGNVYYAYTFRILLVAFILVYTLGFLIGLVCLSAAI